MKGPLSYVIILSDGRTICCHVQHLHCCTSPTGATSDDLDGVEVHPADVTVPEAVSTISLHQLPY